MKRKYLITTISILTLLAVWFVLAYRIDEPIILPYPITVLNTLISLFSTKEPYIVLIRTILRLIIALTFAGGLGMLSGIIAGLSKPFEQFIHPIVTLFRTIPVVSVIVIIWVIVGMRTAPHVITFLMIYPLVHQTVLQGIKSLDKDHMDVWRLDAVITPLVLKNVHLPLIMPFLKAAFVQALGLGIKVLVMSEFITQVNPSIGRELYIASTRLQYDLVFAWTLILVFVVMTIEMITSRLKRAIQNEAMKS